MLRVGIDERKIDEIFLSLNQCHLPGAAVGIAVAGRPVYRKAFGLAHMELPVTLSPSTRMRIYSTTKHFACLAYLLLCEEGKANLEDRLGRHLPELHPVTREVTLRQLMSNTGGLRDPHDLTWQFSGTGRPVSSEDLLSFYRDVEDANFEPGTAWCYGNGGFLLLSAVIERLADAPLEDVLRQRIFEKVGMQDTLLRRVDDNFVPNSATMHMSDGKGSFDRSYVGTALAGEAGMVSTVDDMLRWLAHMDSPRVGSSTTWRLIKQPGRLLNGCDTGYGLGLMIGQYGGLPILHHAGGGQGANSQMLKLPSVGLDVVVLANRHDVSSVQLANRIIDACVTCLEPPIAPAPGPFSSGVFRSVETGRVLQLKTSSGNAPWIEDGRPIAVFDGFEMSMEPDAAGLLRPTELFDYMKVSIELLGDRERPRGVRLSDFGNVDLLERVDAPVGAPAKVPEGQYRSESTGTELRFDPERLRLHSIGRFGDAHFTLEPLADHLWRARSTTPMSWGGILDFNEHHTEMRFTSLRTRALPFRRVA